MLAGWMSVMLQDAFIYWRSSIIHADATRSLSKRLTLGLLYAFWVFFWKHWPSQLCNKKAHSQVFLINLDFSHVLLFSGTVTVFFFFKSSSNCRKMRKKDFECNIIWNRLSDNCFFFFSLCDKQARLKQDSNISSFSVTDKCLNTSSTFW